MSERPVADLPAFPRMSIIALCATPEVHSVVETACGLDAMSRVRPVIVYGAGGSVEAAAQTAEAAGRLRAVIYEMSEGLSRRDLMGDLERVIEVCGQDIHLFVVGHVNDVDLCKYLLAEGVEDYLVAPVSPIDLVRSLAARLARSGGDKKCPLIAVIGSRGGAGATSVACNLGWMLAREKRLETCIVDLDVPFGGVAHAFDVTPDGEASALLYMPERIVDAEMLDQLVSKPPKADRLSLVCAVPDLERAARRDLGYGHAQLISLLRAEFEMVVVDLPLHWTSATEELLLRASTVVVVATPDFAGVPPAQLLVRHMADLRTDTPVVIVNQVGLHQREEWAMADVRKALGVPNLIEVRADTRTFSSASNRGQPVGALASGHPLMKALRKVFAERLQPLLAAEAASPVRLVAQEKSGRGMFARALTTVIGGLLKKRVA
ncbi:MULTISPECIES: hypothetical protein [unclassified Xanthobacter]|uniref:AAA family ATPase n=1 Tax=unclassified Xanthobacter TaxID=2623496 RepID=UPI001F240A84|nr:MULTISPECIES: hypothetical protein [unclassified Xanthobacter]